MIRDAVAVRFQVLPDVIDWSLIPTGAGLGGLFAALAGTFARLEPDHARPPR